MTTEPQPTGDLDTICVNTIGTLAIDAVQQADSGHPGTPMGMAGRLPAMAARAALRPSRPDLAQPRPLRGLRRPRVDSPLRPSAPGRGEGGDPASKTPGRASVTLQDIKTFRELGSRCPGHPDCRWISGLETTTGPLGQGVANSAGMTIASHWLADRCNHPGFDLGPAGRPSWSSRLRPGRHPPVGHDEDPRHPHLHPLLPRHGPGRAHPPARRAPRLPADHPGLVALRPADASEAAEAWRVIMGSRHDPVALVLTRQAVPTLDRARYAPASGLRQSRYVLADPADRPPEVIVIATGRGVSLAVAAYEESAAYRDSVLPPPARARVAVEEASTRGWHRYVGSQGAVIGMHTFGASAPLRALQAKFGFFTPGKVAGAARHQLDLERQRRNP